jgi:hypothetical protein
MMLLHHLHLFARPASPAVLCCTCIALAGCATRVPITQEVKVPVYVSCVKSAPARPEFATRTLAPGASDGEKVLAIARDLPMHLKYEGELEAVIEGCK